MKVIFKTWLTLLDHCSTKTKLLASELQADDYRINFELNEEKDAETEASIKINLSFSDLQFASGSYINYSHSFEAAANDIRKGLAERKREVASNQRRREEEAEKERVYREYLKAKDPVS